MADVIVFAGKLNFRTTHEHTEQEKRASSGNGAGAYWGEREKYLIDLNQMVDDDAAEACIVTQ